MLLKKYIFNVFTEDDKEITFDKLAQMVRKAKEKDCKTKLQLYKRWLARR